MVRLLAEELEMKDEHVVSGLIRKRAAKALRVSLPFLDGKRGGASWADQVEKE